MYRIEFCVFYDYLTNDFYDFIQTKRSDYEQKNLQFLLQSLFPESWFSVDSS